MPDLSFSPTRRQPALPAPRPRLMVCLLRAALLGAPMALAVASPGASAQGVTSADSVRKYDIAAGPLSGALAQFAAQSGILLAADASLTDGKRSAGLRGSHTLAQGLATLLAEGGLASQRSAAGAYIVQRAAAAPARAATVTAAPQAAATPSAATAPVMSTISVVGNWLGQARRDNVFEHAGARDVVRRAQFEEQGATTLREVLNRIPGVMAPESNGTGGQDLALNFGIRGLNPRLASRSNVLMDGVPVPFAPYGQPQLSVAALSLGNMDAVDVVRGGGAVRYGPQTVGGVVNFVTRAIPQAFSANATLHTETSPSSTSDGVKTTASALIGGTADNGLGGAVLYSGVRGSDYRAHSDSTIDDLILKGAYQIAPAHKVSAMAQYYDGRGEMPGGLSTANYARDPYQSTRPYDSFWARRTLLSANYSWKPERSRELTVSTFMTSTLRSGYLDQGANLTLSPREYWVRGAELRYAQGFRTGELRHEIGVGYRFVSEASHELRYTSRATTGRLPSSATSPFDRDTRGKTEAHAVYTDDRINVGAWTITPGLRYEMIDSFQHNLLTGKRDGGNYNTPLPALSALYHLSDEWNLYANTEGSFGAVQYSQLGKAVSSGEIKPERARTYEAGTRYDNGVLQAELGVFTINFDNQYDSSQTTDSVTARGKTRHQGIEGSAGYKLGGLSTSLADFNVYANYAWVNARIREIGPNFGKQVPFSPKHKALFGLGYRNGHWRFDGNGQLQAGQYADNTNTEAENAAGNTGRIPGYTTWNVSGGYQRSAAAGAPALSFGVKNLFDHAYFTRSFDDNKRGKYIGQPRTLYVQVSAGF